MPSTTVDCPPELRSDLEVYTKLISKERKALGRAIFRLHLPGLAIALVAIAINATFPAFSAPLLFAVLALIYFRSRVLDAPRRQMVEQYKSIEKKFEARGLRLCHDPGLQVDILEQ